MPVNNIGTVSNSKMRLPLRRTLSLIYHYVKKRVADQLKSVLFVTIYLAVFQLLILRMPIRDSLEISAGILVVAIGLAAFLEGLFLAIMPLGEQCGLHLPGKVGLWVVILFAAILGVTATFAEPAIGFVQSLGSSVLPWNAPMLYYLLNDGARFTVWAIAIGVGIAVVFGTLRFLFHWSLKPFIFILIPSLLALTWVIMADPRTMPILGLAWDAGGITTGPVTVPLVLALGIGISRIAGTNKNSAEGLGVVTLASAFPIMTVMILGLILAPQMPAPQTLESFFAHENIAFAQKVIGISHEDILSLAHGLPSNPESFSALVHNEKAFHFGNILLSAVQAILPLSVILLFTLLVIIKRKVPFMDEVVLGIGLAIIGFFLFTVGMQQGLQALGAQTGESLPRAYKMVDRPDKLQVFRNVDTSNVITSVDTAGRIKQVLPINDGNKLKYIPFHRERYNGSGKTYSHIPVDMPIWYNGGPRTGYIIILVFMCIMGIGATLAEPSLTALGTKLEEITGGAYKRSVLVLTVAIGVGIGMVFGFARILFDLPMIWILVGAYGITLFLTLFSDEEFTAIAWDSAGVTTGPITVPLVIATGVGIGAQAGVADSFGVIASASVFPILTVLLSGIAINHSRKRYIAVKDEQPSIPSIQQEVNS